MSQAGAIGWVALAVLTAVLMASIVGKVAYREDTFQFFSELAPSIPPLLSGGAAVLGEVLVLGTVLVAPDVGGAVAALWIAGATSVLLAGRRRLSSCSCCGKAKPITTTTLLRNAVLGALGIVAWLAPTQITPGELSAAAVVGAALVVGQGARSLHPQQERMS